MNNISYALRHGVDRNRTFHISVYDRDGRIWINLGNQSNHYSPSVFPWKDKEIKAIRKKLLAMAPDEPTALTDAINEVFPEATSIEFQAVVLDDQAPFPNV